MIWLKRKYRKLMMTHNHILLLLVACYGVLFIMTLLPMFNYALTFIMKLWGRSYVTSENLVSLLTYPPMLLLMFISLIIFSIYILFMMTTLILYTFTAQDNFHPSITQLLIAGFKESLRLLRSGNKLLFLLYSILFYLLLHVPVLAGITLYLRFPNDLWGGASDRLFIKGLILLILILYSIITSMGIFAFHYCIHDGQSLPSSIRQSKKLLKSHLPRTVRTLILYEISMILAVYILYYVMLTITALFIFLIVDKSIVITAFLSVYPKINFYTIMLAGIIFLITNINVISSLFRTYLPQDGNDFCTVQVPPVTSDSEAYRYRHLLAGILIFVIAFGSFSFYITIRYDSFYLKEALSGIMITSHRGNSFMAPENTIPALEYAIQAHSDYAEIDIQQCLDGTIVLMHDRTLWRTTRDNRVLTSLTLEQLKQLDAGSWFAPEYINTPIPTLEEAFEYCKGKVRLNIDIKYYDKKDSGLEEALVALIDQYDLERSCIISSMDYPALVKIKELNPNIKTGLILSVTYGNLLDKKYVDFYSLRSSFISKSIVESVHHEGKEIHAWTVNRTNELERMMSLGVDNIITDNPIRIREELHRDDTAETFINLLNRMLGNRSFYQLVQWKN
ncbi:MAG TPA: glycerophosphodiester phosphodiesterase [Mobilitalea sp.]|nr:glycerophosphodiester phosphodiesterase [Mobilitalea sp.]